MTHWVIMFSGIKKGLIMGKLTKEEIKSIIEAIKIHNEENPDNKLTIITEESKINKAFNLLGKMTCLIMMIIFVSCEVPEDVKAELEKNQNNQRTNEQLPYLSVEFKERMQQYFYNDPVIVLENVNEPYNQIEIHLDMYDYELVLASIVDGSNLTECEVEGEPNIEGRADFDIGNCYGVEFHWEFSIFQLQGLMYNSSYYEVISQ